MVFSSLTSHFSLSCFPHLVGDVQIERQFAGQDEEIVGQAVEVADDEVVHRVIDGQMDHVAFGPAADGAADVSQGND